MSHTFFMSGPSEFSKDHIHLSRFCGPETLDNGKKPDNRHCLNIGLYADPANRTETLEGWSFTSVTHEEAIRLRDELNRFIHGVKDSDSVHSFGPDNPFENGAP